jgi:hypothetical protein
VGQAWHEERYSPYCDWVGVGCGSVCSIEVCACVCVCVFVWKHKWSEKVSVHVREHACGERENVCVSVWV